MQRERGTQAIPFLTGEVAALLEQSPRRECSCRGSCADVKAGRMIGERRKTPGRAVSEDAIHSAYLDEGMIIDACHADEEYVNGIQSRIRNAPFTAQGHRALVLG